jgi:tetratricopeptide (TPR) repeat protein
MKPQFRNSFLPFALVALSGLSAVAQAADPTLPADVGAVQDQWAEIMYKTPKAQRTAALEALSKRAETARKAHAKHAGALIWEGIVLSSLAGEKGGVGALGLVKQARKEFEQALAIEPNALSGSAYTSLGSLYYQVPGWPLGFGDDDKAREMLKKALQIDPDGIDANYFYADFLHDQGEDKAAAAALEKAIAAPARPGRELADQGRRKEAQAMLGKLRAQLAKH